MVWIEGIPFNKHTEKFAFGYEHPPTFFQGGFCFVNNQKGANMTQNNNLKTNKKSKDINEETDLELIDDMSELTYTLFSYVEDYPDNLDTILQETTPSDDLP